MQKNDRKDDCNQRFLNEKQRFLNEKQTENFRPIDGFPKYEVSDMGNVRVRETGRAVKAYIHRTGYRLVNLGGCSQQRVGRLVARTFIGRPPKGMPLISHKDGDKLNDRLDNLEWTSFKIVANRPERRRNISVGRMKRVLMLERKTESAVKTFRSIIEAVDWLRENGHPNAGASHICNCCKGKERSCYGWKWRYVDD